ncbi:asparagine synthase-related protein [Acinetobacter radioresistens]|uniref:asparagine synthase-related protein n=1 Tax=Acinetobacter radioresistens TaxID=40216 RepID=UPI0021D39F59|nr:asparagine synthetase B family protein [Acinetobacter radioresistens]MCU4384210.1 7-cyano-7-deazaguanine synthase [Acinetobacter radioresistens]
MKINFFLNDWHVLKKDSCEFYYKGRFFYRGEIVSAELIFSEINKLGCGVFKNISGFFSFIFYDKNEKFIIAAVDLIRSIPLFFSKINEELNLYSDTLKNSNRKQRDSISEDIFRLCGYTIGKDTLYENIKQLRAGSYIKVSNSEWQEVTYFKFTAGNQEEKFRKENFFSELDKSLTTSFENMLKLYSGRQLIVPLSGGYDSRLIISMLKNLNYENVVCFTYGKKNNLESKYSENIAKSLGYQWIFIEYTDEKWKKAWKSKIAKDYVDYSSNDSSLPHIQDWLAVKEMKERKLIKDNAVFVPGHCCVTSYINEDILSFEGDYEKKFIDNTISLHFNNAPLGETRNIDDRSKLTQLIKDRAVKDYYLKNNLVGNIIEYNWRERQSKYIANSLRVYDFFGYNWWIPLWDKSFVENWVFIPNDLRVDRLIFKEYVSLKYNKIEGAFTIYDNAVKKSKVKQVLTRFFGENIINNMLLLRRYFQINPYKNHYLYFGSILNNDEIVKMNRRGYSIIGMFSKKYLDNTWN